MKPMDIRVDIDGVLTIETEGWGPEIYAARTPNTAAISVVNYLVAQGHKITLWTARHLEDREDTEKWLKKHHVRYHKLELGKPHYDLLIDDKAMDFMAWTHCNPVIVDLLINGEEKECIACGENQPKFECPQSKRPCGHHCNHSWTHDQCCWCGKEFGEDK